MNYSETLDSLIETLNDLGAPTDDEMGEMAPDVRLRTLVQDLRAEADDAISLLEEAATKHLASLAEVAALQVDHRLADAVRSMSPGCHLVCDSGGKFYYSRYVSGGVFAVLRIMPEAAMGLCPDHYMPEEIWEAKDE